MKAAREIRNVAVRLLSHQLLNGADFSQALANLSDYPDAMLASRFKKIQQTFEESNSIEQTLLQYPDIFSDDLVYMIQSVHPSAEDKLTLFEDYEFFHQRIVNTFAIMKSASRLDGVYLLFVFLICFAMLGVSSVYVMPKFEMMFAGFGAELPAFTRLVLNAADWFQSFWYVLSAIFLIVSWYVVFRMGKIIKTNNLYQVSSMMARLPLLSRQVKLLALANATGMINSLLNQGAQTDKAVQLVDAYMTEKGFSIQSLFRKLLGIELVQMLNYYEKTGVLEDELEPLTEQVFDNIAHKLAGNNRLWGILGLMVLALLVGSMVIAMYLPIFSMGSVIG